MAHDVHAGARQFRLHLRDQMPTTAAERQTKARAKARKKPVVKKKAR